jgi:hypothetical protein
VVLSQFIAPGESALIVIALRLLQVVVDAALAGAGLIVLRAASARQRLPA